MTFIILSSSYVSNEMQCEFGAIPPCMLPLGGKFLLEYQVESLGESENYLSLPVDYILNSHELKMITNLNLNILRVDAKVPLGMAINIVLSQIKATDRVTILFGDTFVKIAKDNISNVIGMSNAIDYYKWAFYDPRLLKFSCNTYEVSEKSIFNGYLSFESQEVLAGALIASNFDFTFLLNYLMAEADVQLIEVDLWFDFGHLNTYFESKRTFTTERVFNSLEYNDGFLKKASSKIDILKSEVLWFENIPKKIKIYTPTVVYESKNDFYEIEYVNNLSLTEIYLFSRVSSKLWKRILISCFEFLDRCRAYKYSAGSFNWRVTEKNINRWAEVNEHTKRVLQRALFANNETIDDIFECISHPSMATDENNSILMHGDFCFSNILYDFRSNRIRVIDPRGCDFSGKNCIMGPEYYDIAKLAHSIIGRYDEIVAGRYDIEVLVSEYRLIFNDKNFNSSISEDFISQLKIRGYSLKLIYRQMIGLFVSMLPLHEDCEIRQLALFVNALRLKREMDFL